MKKYFRACMMCMTMFCYIPCPFHKWDEEARPLMTLFLPVVGAWIGILWTLTAYLVNWLGFPVLVGAAILCAYPFLVTGGMHMDGYLDVTDAVKSWRDLERRREILKDSHVGSFAVIVIVLLMLAQFAFVASAPTDANYLILIFIPAVSRCGSALAVTALKPMSTSQYAEQKKPKSHIVVLTIMLVVFLAAGFLLCGKYGFALVGCMAGYGLALRRAYKSLDGMNGDVAGYALTIGELCAVAVYALI